MSFICIPPGSAVIYRTIVYVITYLMAGLVLRKRSAKAASVFGVAAAPPPSYSCVRLQTLIAPN